MEARGVERMAHPGDPNMDRGGVANDDCATAQAITLIASEDCATGAIEGDNGTASNGDLQPECDIPTEGGYQDVWYSFNSGTYTLADISLTPADPSSQDWAYVLYTGCDGDVIDCQIAPSGPIEVSLTAGTDYLLRIYSNLDWGAGGPFTLCVSYAIPPETPANDECVDAVELTATATCEPTSATLLGATESMPAAACSGNTATSAKDVWFSFLGTGNELMVQASGLGNVNGVDVSLEVFEGDCGGLTSLGCVDATGSGQNEYMGVTSVENETYYVRVYSWPYSSPPASFDFSICVYDMPGAPVNDGCGATPEALAAGSTLTFSGTTMGATSDGDFVAGSELDGENPTVWHAFTTTECTDVTISYCGTNPAFENTWIFLAPSCPAGDDYILATSYSFSTCDDGNVTMIYEFLTPGTYYLPVMLDLAFANGPYTIAVSAAPCPTGYCIPESANGPGDGDYISNVHLGDINNTTGGVNAYEDYTAQSTNLTVGADYSLSIVTGSYQPDVFAAWIDYNGDSLFQASEKLGEFVSSMSAETISLPFTVPDDAQLAVTRMRVRAAYNGVSMDPCTDYSYGETEDYHVSIVLPDGIAARTMADFTVQPNPNNGDFQIRATETGTTTIQLMDMTGRIVHAEQALLHTGASHSLSLAGKLAAGTYSLRLSNAKGSNTRMVVVK